jgi:uncharacterized protein (TIGR02594 family)
MNLRPYELAKAEIGTVEWANGDNPKVIAYFRDAGSDVTSDNTAWCAAFVGAMLKRAGLKGTGSLLARSYLNWGKTVPIEEAREGDIVIFKRGNSTWQGHVGFFIKKSGAFIEVLGGNQADQVKVSRYRAADLLGVRRVPMALAKTVPAAEPPKIKPEPKPVQNRELSAWGRFLRWLRGG